MGTASAELDLTPRARREVELILDEFGAAAEALSLQTADAHAAVILTQPGTNWNPPDVRVLIKVPIDYPNTKPDLIFVDAGARGPAGTIPRDMNAAPLEAAGGVWKMVSWHLTGGYDPTADNLIGFARSVRVYLSKTNP